jgi:ATP-dependent RNA helicase DDX55/SPB4
MPELKKYYPQAREDRGLELNLPEDFDLNSVAYVDNVKEARRRAIIDAFARGEKPDLPTNKGGAGADAKRRKENAWSSQKEAKAVKEARREKTEVKRKAEGNAKMSEADKARQRELDDLIAKVKAKNAANDGDDEFEGFD